MPLRNKKIGNLYVVSAPAGTGKSTLVSMLVKEFPCIVENISWTTRKPRKGEIQGIHYHFTTEEEFKRKIANRDFLEYVQLYGNYYGTDYGTVAKLQNESKDVVLVIDTQGAMQLKGKIPAIFIFLQPPSMEVLRQRLIARQTEDSTVIEQRLLVAQEELKLADQYDYCIINDDLNTAYQVLKSIFIAEGHRVRKK